MGKPEAKNRARKIRQRRVRQKVQGTPERPRLSVFRSAKHIYAQVVDDTANRVLVAASGGTRLVEFNPHAIAAAVDGSQVVRKSVSGSASSAEQLGRQLADELLASGAAGLLGESSS